MWKSVKLLVIALVVVAVTAGAAGFPVLVAEETKAQGQTSTNWQPDPAEVKDFVAECDRVIANKEAVLNAPGVQDVEKIMVDRPHEWTADERFKVERFVSENGDLIREIRRVADRAQQVFPLATSEGFEMEAPHVRNVRSCARVLRASAAVNGMKGDYDEAVQDIIAGMKLGDALAREPFIVSQLMRMRIYEMMNEAVQCSFDGGDLSSQLTRRLMAHVAQADHREGLACALAGNEEYFAESLALQLCLFRTLFSVVSGDFFPDVAGSSRREIAAKLIYEDVMTRLTSAGRLPYYGATLELKQPRTCLGGLPQSLIHSERYLRACMAQACHEARLDLMQLGILIEQYKERTGSLPATLEALAPQLAGFSAGGSF